MQVFSLVALAGLFAASSAQLPTTSQLVPVPSYKGCPPDGPLLPRPTDLANSKYIQDAAKNLTAMLDSAISGEIEAGWVVENVSFSLALVSPYGPSGTEDNVTPFWEYHHRAKNSEQGATEVNGDTQYLIGSVSKIFSDLVLLKSGVDLQAPVTDFLPQLRSPRSKIRWEEITLETLADHLAGIPPNMFYEFYFLNSFHESLGFPPLEDSEYPRCGVWGLNADCTREEMIESLFTKEQVVPINSKPVYSQLSFTLYTLCLEAHTGKHYSQILEETIYNPLNLTNSGVSPGDTEKAAIPPGVSGWGSDYGLNAPGSGLYSTTNDLSVFLSSILNHSILDTPADVRKWLKPLSTTGSLNTLVGRPWEILRTTDLLPPEHAHTVDIYAKSGGAVGYMAQIAVLDQYGVGLSVLTASPVSAMDILYRAVLGTFVSAIDEETRSHARRFAGTWTSRPSNGTRGDEKIRLTLSLDDGTGLKLSAFTRGNASMIEAIQIIWATEYQPLGFGILSDDFRIYPTDLEIPLPAPEAHALLAESHRSHHKTRNSYDEDHGEDGSSQLVRQEWRINFDIDPLDGSLMSDLPGQNTGTQYCGSWQMVDWMTYGGIGLDKIVFVVNKRTGDVLGVEVPALRGGLLTK
ncbi:beta-lactamase/transpeptidase-like protein [Aspergillus granulosus]|uniref:Beta-lactamase/transpeptidase-like protein n=1 Tax=Aspergillus granulosus TaxID=176169 RepID=A0ABR4H9G1_9EURO